MDIHDIIVIGGGAAGMAAAAAASETLSERGVKADIAVLEKMPRPGRKIMITGKGRCNFTNMKPWDDFSSHIHPNATFLKPAFYSMSPENTVEWFRAAGMESVTERGDRVFPSSYKASDVVDTLSRRIKGSGAVIITGCEVSSVHTPGEDGLFMVESTGGTAYRCRRLVIATGGLSYPSTGSTGDGYRWAEETGHTVTGRFPSLTAIVPKNYKSIQSRTEQGRHPDDMKGHIDRSVPLSETGQLLMGNGLKNVSLTLIIDGNIAQEEFGDIDFTDGGIEGPLGFRVSRRCVNALMNGSKVSVSVDLKPAVNREALESRISRLWKEISEDRRNLRKTYRDRFRILLGRLLPSEIIQGFLKCHPSADHKTLPKLLKDWKFEITGYVGYERCVITAGGISLKDITSRTMESRKCKGLYFAGEVLDLDGDTGGYNLQIAFSTGFAAGRSAAISLLPQ